MAAIGDLGSGRERCGRRLTRGAPHTLRCLGRILTLLTLLGAVSPVLAAKALGIEAAVGFADAFQPGRWLPLGVTVTNSGDDLNGELDVEVTSGDVLRGRPFITTHRRKLELQRGARKTLHFTVLPQSLFHPLVIRVHSGGRELARAAIDLRARQVSDERLLLVLSRDANLDYLNERAVNGMRVLYPHPELLPVHWRGYDAVAAVVVHGVSLERLSAEQFEALHKWIAQGGILAVSGGADYTLLRTPRLAALVPGRPLGMARIDAVGLRDAFPASLVAPHPVHVHRIGPIRGRERLRAADLTLIAERTIGLGRVLYLAFDVAREPFNRWQGMRELWLAHLNLPPPAATPLGAMESAAEGPLPALIRADSADFASPVNVTLFLALYGGLLLAGFHLSSREGRLRTLAPLWNWAAPALFALTAWLLFGPAVFPRGATSVSVALIEPYPDSGYARLEVDLGVYANRSGTLRLEYRGAEPVLYPRQPQRGGDRGNWILGEGARPYLEPLERQRYVLHALHGEDVIAFDLKVRIHEEAEGLRLVFDNASGRAINDMQLVFNGHVYEIGSMAAGVRGERRLTRRTHGFEPGKASWRDLVKPTTTIYPQVLEPARIVLERKSKAAGENGYPRPGQALLVGYTASPLRPAGASADWPRRERALVALRIASLPGNAPTGGTAVLGRQQGDHEGNRAEVYRVRDAAAKAAPVRRDE